MNQYEKFFCRIQENKRKFELLLDFIQETDNELMKIYVAQKALTFAVYKSTGYFYSTVLENFYVNLAEKNHISLENIDFTDNSFLHVMTECYPTGGHTRIVERWIENAYSDEKHSVILLKQKNIKIPNTLKDNIKKRSGELFILNDDEDQISKALELRKLGMRYKYIILHVHMDDPVPTIAFGSRDFTRPVILFNHAQHMFWIGKRIADIVADFMIGRDISRVRRKLSNIYKLPIPVDSNITEKINKVDSRKRLGISTNQKMIITVGSAYKYRPILNDYLFFEIIDEILDQNLDAYLYVIGPDNNEVDWDNLKNKYGTRIVILGSVSFDEGYIDYLNAADILIDSYPVAGGTVCVDAVKNNCPFLSLKNVLGNVDFIAESEGFCKDKDEMFFKVNQMLNDKVYLNNILENEKKLYEKDYSRENWKLYLKRILSGVKLHTIKNLDYETEPVLIDDYCVALNEFYKKDDIDFVGIDKLGICVRTKGIPFLCEKRTYESYEGTSKFLILFGLKIKYKWIKK